MTGKPLKEGLMKTLMNSRRTLKPAYKFMEETNKNAKKQIADLSGQLLIVFNSQV